MAQIEDEVATEIAGKIDQGDESAAKPSADFGPMHGGSATLGSIHASSATQPMAGSSMHGGADTEPLGAGFNVVPTDNEDNLTRLRAEVRASEAETIKSLRRHAIGFVESPGTIAGIVELKNERAK